jgi:predicted ATPase
LAGDSDIAGIRTTAETVPLVGRERELQELESGLREASGGQGRLFLIAGEPGIGKTSLAEAVAERGSDQGMLPLWGRAWESAGAPAYWPWTQLLRTLVASRETSLLEAEIGASGQWLVQVLPELGERLPGLGTVRSSSSETARFALFDAVATFLRDAAETDPLVIVLDDLHAADPGSLLMLEFVARTVIAAPILLIATFQEAAARQRPDVERLIGALARESRKLVLKGVGEKEIGAIVEHRSGRAWPPELLDALYEATEGNPFFTAEVVRLLSGDGSPGTLVDDHGRVRFPLPDSVRETVRRRFEALGPETVEALEVAAVIGREFRIATVDLAISTKTPLIDLIDEAASAGLVTEVPGSIGRFRFTHNLIRESLYADLGTARRVKLHRLVAEAIEENYGETADRFAELAHHFAEASPGGDATKALDYAVRAGDEAMRLYAYEQAAQLYQLAIEMGDVLGPDAKRKAGLMLALGQAQAHADHRGARETLIAAGEAALAADEPGLLAEAALSMRAWPLGAGVLDDQPGALLSEALERLDPGDTPLRARLLARLGASLYYWPGTEERREALGEEAVTMARRLGDPETLAHVLANAQIATWGPSSRSCR